LVGRQSAQLRRADRAGAVGDGRAREVQRRQRARERGGQLGGAGGGQRLRGEDVDRRLRFGHGAVADPGAGDDDRVEGAGFGRRGCGGVLGERGRGGQGGKQGDRERGGARAHGGSFARRWGFPV